MQKNEVEELILRRTVNWDDLRYFIIAADTGSLNQAATRLGVTQPTLSRRIDNLEYSLGAKLFQRQPNGITMTAAGAKILKYAMSMQNAANDIGRMVAGSDDAKSGSVKLYSPDGLAAYWLTPGLREFQRANPKLTIELINAMFTAFDPDQQIDVAIQFDESKHIDAIAYPLGNLHYCLYASREYLQTYGTPKTLQDLLSHRIVTHENYRFQKHSWDREIEALKELCNIVLQTNCSASLLNAIKGGLGIGALPTYVTCLDIDVVPLQLDLKASVKFWAVFHRDIGKTARVRTVIDWLKTRFDAERYPYFAEEFIHPQQLVEMMKSKASATDKTGTRG